MLVRISVRDLDTDPAAFTEQLVAIESLDVDRHGEIPDSDDTIKDFDLMVDTDEDTGRLEERVRIVLNGFDDDFEVFNVAVHDVDPS